MDFDPTQNVYRERALTQFDWLEHGFGTRLFRPPESLATLRQTHSDKVVYADGTGCLAEGDSLLSNTPGRMVGVKTADCLPILMVDARRRAVAAVHAGWRGAVSRIVEKTVYTMSTRWTSRPEDLHAAIGPGIGPCCFEVGPEVAIQFGEAPHRGRIDLAGEVRRQLVASGVASQRIYLAGLCTFCQAELFHSFRRDREKAGRMFSVIGVK